MARGHVVAQSHDLNGNVMSRVQMKILDIWTHQVEFTGGEVTEFTANVIAKSMYAQCVQTGMIIYS